MNHWYFAYGSNLLVEQMRSRVGCSFITEHENAELRPRMVTLPKHRVNFSMLSSHGRYYANIVPADEDALGVIYRCNSQALDALDTYEVGYRRTIMQVHDSAGLPIDAVVYVALAESTSDSGRPDLEYLNRILRGGREHGLPESYLRKIEAVSAWTPTG